MLKTSLKLTGIGRQRVVAVALAVVFFVVAPIFAFSSHRNGIYVNSGASGTQDGSSSHPYSTINKALDAAGKNTDIHVTNGAYHENITLKEGVRLFGESEDGVVIKASNDNNPVVTMKDDTRINKVTVKDGEVGIRVKEDAKVSIIECTVKNNDQDGIKIDEGDVKDSQLVSISESEIKDNGRAGIYSKKRKLSLIKNDIVSNHSNGIDLEAGAGAWMDNNELVSNGGSGLKLRLDGSTIWTKNNNIKNNHRDGLEVVFAGQTGRINFDKAHFSGNRRYALSQVQTFAASATSLNTWKKMITFDAKTIFMNNGSGDFSPVIVRN